LNILVTLDRNYLVPLRVLLCSLFLNNPGEVFDIYLISDDLDKQQLSDVDALCARYAACLHLIPVGKDCFADAPTLRYYSKAMYYRLLAADLLPESLDRILYLDPDMLVINPLRPLYDTPLDGYLYGACIHAGLMNISKPLNQLRLSTYEAEGYFNSGMLLMNLNVIRQEVRAQDIFDYADKYRQLLILPDQDILNGLYGAKILPLDDMLWNFDPRQYREYLLASSGERNMDWIIRNTAILHFAGKKKPWHKSCPGRFTPLYKHYMQLTKRQLAFTGS